MKLPRLSPRLTTGLLIGSVCLNLFAAAVFAVALLRHDHHGRGPGAGPGFGLVERAPHDARPILRAAFDAHKDEFRSRFEAVRAAAREVGRLMESGETDPEQMHAAFTSMRMAFDQVELLTHDIIIETLPELDDADRAAWGEQWTRGRRR